MKKVIEFTIPKATPSLNTMLRLHYTKRSEQQKAWDWYVFLAWQNSKKFVFMVPVKVQYTIRFSSTQKRDLDNYIGGTKYVTDSLKRTFLTRDDSEWLQEISVKFELGTEEQTLVHIEEI